MDMAVRSFFTAGVTAVAASAIALAPSVAPPPTPRASTIQLAAQSRPLLDQFDRISTLLANGKAIAVVPAGASPGVGAAAAVQPYNTASNVINAVYGVSRYWANYVSLELGPWLIGWIPFGYLINDQIYIWYPTFVLPVVDSFVYDFLDPVVNDPLNPTVWANGLSAIANTAWNGVVSGVGQEIDYLLSLRWLPFPIPPLPPLPFAAAQQQTATLAADLATTEQPAETTPAGVLEALGQRLGLHNPLAEDVDSADLADQVSIPDAVSNADEDVSAAVEDNAPAYVATVPDLDPTDAPVLKAVVGAPRKAADGVVAAQGAVKGAVDDVADAVKNERKAVRDAVKAAPTTVAKTVRDGVSKAVNGFQKAGDGVEKAAGAVAKARGDIRKAAHSDSEE